MDTINTEQQLPAVLFSTAVEFFIHEDNLKCYCNGERYDYNEFPNWIIKIMKADMAKNPEATALFASNGIADPTEQLRQYIAERYGRYDMFPDIDEMGNVSESEYINNSSLRVKNGSLTKKEIEVLKLIAKGKLDKEIANDLGVTEETIRTHSQNIRFKTGLKRKAELAVYAFKLNLIL